MSFGGAFLSDYSESDIIHVLDFTITNGKIEAIAIVDVVAARELSTGKKQEIDIEHETSHYV